MVRAAGDGPLHQRPHHVERLSARLNRLRGDPQRRELLDGEGTRAQSRRRLPIAYRQRDARRQAKGRHRAKPKPVHRDEVGKAAAKILDAIAAERRIEPRRPIEHRREARQIDQIGQRLHDLVGVPHRRLACQLARAADPLAEQRTVSRGEPVRLHHVRRFPAHAVEPAADRADECREEPDRIHFGTVEGRQPIDDSSGARHRAIRVPA